MIETVLLFALGIIAIAVAIPVACGAAALVLMLVGTVIGAAWDMIGGLLWNKPPNWD